MDDRVSNGAGSAVRDNGVGCYIAPTVSASSFTGHVSVPELLLPADTPTPPRQLSSRYWLTTPGTANLVDRMMMAAKLMPIILENGRKIYGPPPDINMPRPPVKCELYISCLDENADEGWLLYWFHRLGVVYEMRIMMNSSNLNRGYGFVRFCYEYQAKAAAELTCFLFMTSTRLRVFRSLGKNRLFVNNIPMDRSIEEVTEGFATLFPTFKEVRCLPPSLADERAGKRNRGYAFIIFEEHEIALEAKKRVSNGTVLMFNTELKVRWAQMPTVQPIFRLTDDYLRQNNDYCAKLRLYCLANCWAVPIVVYGDTVRRLGIQYGAVFLRNPMTGATCQVIVEVSVCDVSDIHLLICEVAVNMIEDRCDFPDGNYMVHVSCPFKAHIVYMFNDHPLTFDPDEKIDFHASNVFKCGRATANLLFGLQSLRRFHTDIILAEYQKSFQVTSNHPLPVLTLYTTEFYSIYPKFRSNPPLHNNFNDTEIVLLLKSKAISYILNDDRFEGPSSPLPIQYGPVLHLKSQRMVWHLSSGYRLRYVNVRGRPRWFYHPLQKMNSHPLWIYVQSFETHLFKDYLWHYGPQQFDDPESTGASQNLN